MIKVARGVADKDALWVEGELKEKRGLFYVPLTRLSVRLSSGVHDFDRGKMPVGRRVTFLEGSYHAKEVPGEDSECMICKNLADNPHQSKCCGHTMCYNCAHKWGKRSDSCPNCRVSPFLIVEDPRTKRHISSLTVYCPHYQKSCDWEGSLSRVSDHLADSCKYAEIYCPNEDCEMKFQRRQLEKHLKMECPGRYLSCPCCSMQGIPVQHLGIQEPLTYKYVVEEHYKVCPDWPMRCPNNKYCNTIDLTRSTLQGHVENSCPEQVISCQFAEAGCTVKVKRKNMADHVLNSTRHHLSDLMSDYISVKNKHAETVDLLAASTSDYDEIKKQHAKTFEILAALSSSYWEMKKEHDDLKKNLAEMSYEHDELIKDYNLLRLEHDEMKVERVKMNEELDEMKGKLAKVMTHLGLD